MNKVSPDTTVAVAAVYRAESRRVFATSASRAPTVTASTPKVFMDPYPQDLLFDTKRMF